MIPTSSKLAEIEATGGAKRKRDDADDGDRREEDEIIFKNDVKLKQPALNAQVMALQKEFGNDVPQAFDRPKYKFVHSPWFPAGQLVGPQRITDYDGNPKVIPRRFDCPHVIVDVDFVHPHQNIPCDGCYE